MRYTGSSPALTIRPNYVGSSHAKLFDAVELRKQSGQRKGTMAARFSNLLWRFDLFLGGSIWIAVLALAYSAGPIEEAVFWASLIAALPVGFGWICRCILTSKNGAASDQPAFAFVSDTTFPPPLIYRDSQARPASSLREIVPALACRHLDAPGGAL